MLTKINFQAVIIKVITPGKNPFLHHFLKKELQYKK